jgi:DNA-binding response OmpR family regulator
MNICPHCGYNLEADKPIERGPWSLSLEAAYYKGARVPLTATQAAILYALARANRYLTAEALMNRVTDTESDDPGNLIGAHIAHIRKRLGSLSPIETGWRRGYRWVE